MTDLAVKPTVAIVKCPDYHPETVSSALHSLLELLEFSAGEFSRENDILIKPNLLTAKSPEKAVTTHPEIVRALIRFARQAGFKVKVGDSPAIRPARQVARAGGILEVIEQEFAEFIKFSRPERIVVADSHLFKEIELASEVLAFGRNIINVPKLKTHELTVVTGAVKNLFGCVPGIRKAKWHLRAEKDVKLFSRLLVEIYDIIRPALTVVDAVQIMEGKGPNCGDPRHLGLLIGGRDCLAVDTVIEALLGLKPGTILTNAAARDTDFGCTDVEKIEVKGEKISTVGLTDLKLPAAHANFPYNMPAFVQSLGKKLFLFLPYSVSREKCTGCGNCRNICPVDAITLDQSGPRFDYGKCISCYCCQEVCDAGKIRLKPGLLARFF